MQGQIFQVDAFAARVFGGNPAAVMPMEAFPADRVMQSLAAENSLAETAFIVGGSGDYQLRWFTPTVEVPLCGHATLASAAVVMERLEPHRTSVRFHTLSGTLTVQRDGATYTLNLPAYDVRAIEKPDGLEEALGIAVIEVLAYPGHLLALAKDARTLRAMAPDFVRLSRFDGNGVVVTAAGDEGYDFVSRFFAPSIGIPEDPVTGGAHCALVPYWANRLNRKKFSAYQASSRGGEIGCKLVADRVELTGAATLFMEGTVAY